MCFPDFGVFVETELKSIKTLCNSRKKILQDFGLHLIGDKFPSMNRSAKASLGKFNDKNIVQSLKDFVRDDQSLKQARIDMFKSLDKRKPIKILGDDYVIEKIGKSIDGTSFQFDHVQNKQVNGFLLVDIAVRQDDMIYAIVFAQRDPVNKNKFKKSSKSSDEEKTRQILIRKLIIQLRKELKLAGFSNKKITVILDRWYPTDGLFKFLRSLKVNFVVGIKKSALVLLPDRKKFLLSLIQRRGRPMSDFTKTVRIEDYLEKYQKMHSFFDPDRNTTLLFKSARVNLNIAKQVKVFAFMYENQTEWRYIVCNIKIRTAKQAYNLHKDRWPIENVHYDVKQIFGIKEGHMRLEQHVQAHLKFVYFLYQAFLKYKIQLKKKFDFNLTARMLFDHVSHLIDRVPDPLQLFLGE